MKCFHWHIYSYSESQTNNCVMKLFHIIILFSSLIFIAATSYPQQQSGDTSKVLIRFSEPISREGIFDIRNYQIIKDDSTTIKIFKVGVANDDRFIVLFTEKQNPNSSYRVIINNIKDKTGHLISESHKTAIY